LNLGIESAVCRYGHREKEYSQTSPIEMIEKNFPNQESP